MRDVKVVVAQSNPIGRSPESIARVGVTDEPSGWSLGYCTPAFSLK